MDFWDLTRLVFRRWYVAVPMLLLTVGGAVWTVTGVEPDYIATAHMQLVPPATVTQNPINTRTAPTSSPHNPWLDLGLSGLSAAGAVTVQDRDVIKQLEASGLSGSYTVTLGNQIPLVTFEVVGTSQAQATTTVDTLTSMFDRNVVALQDAYGAPKNEKISTRRLDLGSNVTESNKKVKRALVAVAGAGVLLTAAVTIGVDAFLRRRATRRRRPVDPATTPASGSTAIESPAAPAPRPPKAAVTATAAARASDAGLAEQDRTVIIRQRALPAKGSVVATGLNGSAGGDQPANGANGSKPAPPGESTIVLPSNVYGSVYGRRSEDEDDK